MFQSFSKYMLYVGVLIDLSRALRTHLFSCSVSFSLLTVISVSKIFYLFSACYGFNPSLLNTNHVIVIHLTF